MKFSIRDLLWRLLAVGILIAFCVAARQLWLDYKAIQQRRLPTSSAPAPNLSCLANFGQCCG
jgi:hypothetical protein